MLEFRSQYATFRFQNLTHLVFQSLEHQVHRFEPHCYGSVNFSCRLVDEDALPDSILGQISVEVSLRFIQDFQVRSDDNCLKWSVGERKGTEARGAYPSIAEWRDPVQDRAARPFASL
jgi:hypothetical protein